MYVNHNVQTAHFYEKKIKCSNKMRKCDREMKRNKKESFVSIVYNL